MGDFDRQESGAGGAKPNDTKKAVLALLLGIVLIGLMANWYLKRSIQPVVGEPPKVEGGLAVPIVDDDLSPAAITKLQADLKNDPTRKLLQAPSATQVAVLPRNPFSISNAWLLELYPPKPPEPNARGTDPKPPEPGPRPVVPVVEQPVVLNAADYKLQSLFSVGPGFGAMINSKTVNVGDIIGVAKVLEIRDDAVVLQHVKYPNGPKLVLPWNNGLLSRP